MHDNTIPNLDISALITPPLDTTNNALSFTPFPVEGRNYIQLPSDQYNLYNIAEPHFHYTTYNYNQIPNPTSNPIIPYNYQYPYPNNYSHLHPYCNSVRTPICSSTPMELNSINTCNSLSIFEDQFKKIDRDIRAYIGHMSTDGDVDHQMLRKIGHDLLNNPGTEWVANIIFTSPFITSDHIWRKDPTNKKIWIEDFLTHAYQLNNGQSFLWNISPSKGKHAIYALVEKHPDGTFKFFIGNAGIGLTSNPDFHPKYLDNGVYKYQTTAIIENINLSYEKLSNILEIIDEGYESYTDEDTMNVDNYSLINNLYKSLQLNFGKPLELDISNNPNFFSREQVGPCCKSNSFWPLLKVLVGNEISKDFKNSKRYSLMIHLSHLCQKDPQTYNKYIPVVKESIIKLNYMLLNKNKVNQEEFYNKKIYLTTLYNKIQSVENIFITNKINIAMEKLLPQYEYFSENTPILDLLNIYVQLFANNINRLENLVSSVSFSSINTALSKLNSDELEILWNLFSDLGSSTQNHVSRSERLVQKTILELLNLLHSHLPQRNEIVDHIEEEKYNLLKNRIAVNSRYTALKISKYFKGYSLSTIEERINLSR